MTDEELFELARQIRRDRVERARRMSFEQKFWAGAELFDTACEVTKGGIRSEHPEWGEEQVMAELRRRLARRRERQYRLGDKLP
jgi:hypothetical protein